MVLCLSSPAPVVRRWRDFSQSPLPAGFPVQVGEGLRSITNVRYFRIHSFDRGPIMVKFFRNAARNERAGRSGGGRGFRVILLGGLAVGIVLSGGCTRRFFRKRTDEQVDAIMKEKDKYPQWGLSQYHVYPDPRSRFADWTNPDRPPKPPDDPAAYLLSPNPQKAP